MDGKTFQVGKVLDVIENCGLLWHGELPDIPEHVGVKGLRGTCLNLLAQGRFHGFVHQLHPLYHTGDGVLQGDNRADQAVFSNGNGLYLRHAGGKMDAVFIHRACCGGVGSIGGVIDRTAGSCQMDVDILAVEAGGTVRRGSGRAFGGKLSGNGRVCNAVQQPNSVQKLILGHIGLAQDAIGLCGGNRTDSLGQSRFGLGEIAVGPVLAGKLNGHILVMAGEIVGKGIEPGGQPGIAVQIVKSGLTEQRVPGEDPVIVKQIPEDADQNEQSQRHRNQKSDCFFHRKLLRFAKILCNYTTTGVQSQPRLPGVGFLGKNS